MSKSIKNNLYIKLTVVFIMTIILLVPATWVRHLITEREEISNEASSEVSEKWGSYQVISGPILNIPYSKKVVRNGKVLKVKEGWLRILPEELNIDGNVDTEVRKRSIYETVLYETAIQMNGKFNLDKLQGLNLGLEHLDLKNAVIDLGITDLKGVEDQIVMRWNDSMYTFNPGITYTESNEQGMHTHVEVDQLLGKTYNFSTEIVLKGSSDLYFTPIGKTTDVKLKSSWNSPSFTGEFLADEHHITEDGFSAHWNILNLNRNFPQYWLNNNYHIHNSDFGVKLKLPVDHYQKSDRVAKYAILFLGFTFLTFFFVEVLQKVSIHPIQYLLVGVAIIVFYILLLSFSEHIAFNLAYGISTAMTILLITFYSAFALKSLKLSLMQFLILMVLYGFIFILIGQESYALLLGSLGVFLVLAIVMFISRKVNWDQVSIGTDKSSET